MRITPNVDGLPDRRRRFLTAAIFLVATAVYVLTMATSIWHTDVYGANWTSWHLATTGSPWIDGSSIPDVGHRSDFLLAIVHTANGHTAFARFPGIVVASLPAYLLLGRGSMSIVPGSLTAAILSAWAVALMFAALRQHLTERRALLAAIVFGFATPMWTISANLLWPHTVTVLGIAGIAWAASTGRWWWTGVFGGIALWGRLHTAVIVGVVGIWVGVHRRQYGVILRTGVTSGLFLLANCAWNRWMYGSWSPLGGYGESDVAGATESYRYSVTNQLGMWLSPDRGILIWTPIVLLLLPALLRSWPDLPDWSRSLVVGGLLYTLVQGAMMTFTGGDGFYGYRYGLEFLTCATPALALSQDRVGRVARALAGPVLGVQFLAFLVGAFAVNLWIPKTEVWRDNAFIHALNVTGPTGWFLTAFVALGGWLAARRITRIPKAQPTEVGVEDAPAEVRT